MDGILMHCSSGSITIQLDDQRSGVITFNGIPRSAGFDPTRVRLVRHLDTGRRDPTIYAAWRSANGRHLVEEYQRIQSRTVFRIGDVVASFVVTPHPRNETLFMGLYH